MNAARIALITSITRMAALDVTSSCVVFAVAAVHEVCCFAALTRASANLLMCESFEHIVPLVVIRTVERE